MNIYSSIVRPLLFKIDPELVHNFFIAMGAKLGHLSPIINLLHSNYNIEDARLESKIDGILFKNPIGLAAGYDKSGQSIQFLESLGFSHIEIGSISAESSIGNPKPRLFRLPEDKALVVHYGLQNDGAEAVAKRLNLIKRKCPLGINIVKTNRGINAPQDNEDTILKDFEKSALLLKDHGDYLTFNMSCPNTEMGRDYFADKEHIVRFLTVLSDINFKCPVFLKISPVGGIETIEKYLETVDSFSFVSGFIFNLPPGKSVPLKTSEEVWKQLPGAISGKPIESLINYSIGEMYKRMDSSKYSIIGAGGVFSAEDAYRKITLGSSVVQLLTSMVYNGPSVVKKINEGLIQLFEADGFKDISEAIGTAH
ncbi:MAG: quinone-dependent dihydroorotate dehydrogenase [Bacteroidota bacterium]